MKKLLNIFICLLPFSLMAQNIDRSKAPTPGKAPLIQVGNPVKFTLSNGLKVFVVKNTKLPRVVASLNFDVDGFKEGDKAGLADIAGQLAKRGTISKSKEQLDEAVEYLGGACHDCGGKFPLPVYDFHHLDPTEKEHNLGNILRRKNFSEIEKELSKCVLLCANCHRIRHFEGGKNEVKRS